MDFGRGRPASPPGGGKALRRKVILLSFLRVRSYLYRIKILYDRMPFCFSKVSK